MKRVKFYTLLVFLAMAFGSTAQVPFTPGNIVVYRIGDNINTLGVGVNVPFFLDEYTPSGVLVQSIAMPTNFISNSPGVGRGLLNLSSSGKYLVVPGNDNATGARQVALVDYNGIVNTPTTITGYSGTLKSAISDDNSNLWISGSSTAIRYTSVGASTSTQITTTNITSSNINISDGQLYYSSQTIDPTIGTIGTGLPTTTGQTVSGLPGIPNLASGFLPFQFAFADLNSGVVGADVLYVADQSAPSGGGIHKFSLVGGSWVSNGVVGTTEDSYQGLTVKVLGTTVTIFATRRGNNNGVNFGGDLVSLIDNSGYNGALAGTPTVIASTSVDKATFRGVALVPQAPALKVAIKTFLQGAYSSGLGRHKDVTSIWAGILNANALSQPYNTAAFNNYAGTESVSAGFFTSTGATTDILDWVLVELRNSATPATVVARRAAFIREDGQIVDLDGTSDVSFPGVTAGNYYVVVRHRNHLPIRSSSAIALSSTATLYDFSAQQSNAYQDGAITTNAAMKDVSGSGTVFAMWGGNANSNTKVSFTGVNNDAGSILGALGGNQGLVSSSVYNFADLNLDGSVKYTGTNNDSGLLLSVLGSNQAAVYTQHQ